MGYYAEAAKRAELEHRWDDAYLAWMSEGGEYAIEQAKACLTIVRSTELGNRFREKINGLREKLDEHKITIYDYMNALNVAHDEVYNN